MKSRPATSRSLLIPALLLSILTANAATPCLWDEDTLKQERARFPTTLELITGKFPRHSDAYYKWRIQDRTARIEAGVVTPELFDDLAVAHSKLGDDARAIELMAEKEELFPGMYETAANLGTFHLHANHLEQGIENIQRAISINPDAHFGREVYQELLARYVLQQRGDAARSPRPLMPELIQPAGQPRTSYWLFVKADRAVSKKNQDAEIAAAAKGVLGMLRFGNHDSPVLLEALSDLLLADYYSDAKRLAARALLKASYEVEDETARAAYRAKAEAALQTQTPEPNRLEDISLDDVERTFATELEEARRWWKELEAKEHYWIEAGEDVDARFGQVYYARGTPPISDDGAGRQRAFLRYGGWVAGIMIVIAASYMISMARRG
jgi:tetratricopeptide (TPR) repeat protein